MIHKQPLYFPKLDIPYVKREGDRVSKVEGKIVLTFPNGIRFVGMTEQRVSQGVAR